MRKFTLGLVLGLLLGGPILAWAIAYTAGGGGATNLSVVIGGPLTVPNGGTGATSLTDGGILLGSGTGAITALGVATNGQIPIGDGTTDPVLATLTEGANITITNGAGSITVAAATAELPRSYLAGLELSRDAVNTDRVDIAVGEARDSTDAADIALTAALEKDCSVAFAVGDGNGGLDTGAFAADTWYHIHLIRRSDTGVVDALCSTSATSPTFPTNFDQRRRIGSVLSDSTPTGLVLWEQFGDEFIWDVPIQDFDVTNPGTTAVTRTLTVPIGIQVLAISNFQGIDFSPNLTVNYLVTSLDQADTVPSGSVKNVITLISGADQAGNTVMRIRTNTSAQVRTRLSVSNADVRFQNTIFGWIDWRGRDD